jgi:hypothetical protein
MAIEKVIRDFVREYYVISYLPKKKMIVFEDDNEGMICESTPNKIELGKFKGNTVYLMWGNIKEITGIEYHHKDYVSDLSTLFSDIYRNKLTRDFFEVLMEGNVPVQFTLKEMINYFPTVEE